MQHIIAGLLYKVTDLVNGCNKTKKKKKQFLGFAVTHIADI